MKKTVLVLVMLLVSGVVFGQEKVKTTGVQGNLTELVAEFGAAKTYIVELEQGQYKSVLNSAVHLATDKLKDTRDLLDKYDYPDEDKILRQVVDLEQRLLKFIMGL